MKTDDVTLLAVARILAAPPLACAFLEEITCPPSNNLNDAARRIAVLARRVSESAEEEQFEPALRIFNAIGDFDAVNWVVVTCALVEWGVAVLVER